MTATRKMKALVAVRYGSPAILRIAEVPFPVPGAGEVLVRVEATTVNRTDTATLRAHPFFARAITGLLKPRFEFFGMEFAGVVVASGPDTRRFSEGARVFGMSPERFGAHAEFIRVPETGAIEAIPEGLPFAEALLSEGAWYAWGSVGGLTSGARVLIYGGSGAIGTAAVQLAKAQGAHVTAVTGPRHLELLRELGADAVLDYTTGEHLRLQGPFDLVMDAVGKTSYFEWRRRLTPSGHYRATDLGPWWSNIVLGAVSTVTGSRRVAVPFPDNAPGFLAMLREHIEAKRIRAVIDRVYPFAKIAEAYAYVERGQKTGIVVVNVTSEETMRKVFESRGAEP